MGFDLKKYRDGQEPYWFADKIHYSTKGATPLCGHRAQYGTRRAEGMEVTCKRCLKSMDKLNREVAEGK